MNKTVCTIFFVILILIVSNTAFAHGNMTTVYSSDDIQTRYVVIPEEQVPSYEANGWSRTPPFWDMSTHTGMYSADGRFMIFSNEEAYAQSTAGWHYTPLKLMYSHDNRTLMIYASEIPVYENVGWYIEPVALMINGNEGKYVISSETDFYRQAGWRITEYSADMPYLATQIKQYLSTKRGLYGIYIKNLNDGRTLVINDGSYSAASIMKLYVMAGIYNEIGSGRLYKTPEIQSLLTSMITMSDNRSSNRLVKIMGGGNYLNGFNAENTFARSIGCTLTQHLSLYSGCGEYVSYGRNYVSPQDCGILLEKIYKRELVSPTYSEEMLYLLTRQTRRDKIPYYLPKNTLCANKTGENSKVQSDVGIVYSPNCPYIICVITNNSPSGIIDVRQISAMTYWYFNS